MNAVGTSRRMASGSGDHSTRFSELRSHMPGPSAVLLSSVGGASDCGSVHPSLSVGAPSAVVGQSLTRADGRPPTHRRPRHSIPELRSHCLRRPRFSCRRPLTVRRPPHGSDMPSGDTSGRPGPHCAAGRGSAATSLRHLSEGTPGHIGAPAATPRQPSPPPRELGDAHTGAGAASCPASGSPGTSAAGSQRPAAGHSADRRGPGHSTSLLRYRPRFPPRHQRLLHDSTSEDARW